MNTLFLTALLLSPMISPNPAVQDTLDDLNLHIVAGGNMGGEVTDAGPEFGMKVEYLLLHPIVVRLAGSYTFAEIKGTGVPDGDKRTLDAALETFVYRGRGDYFIYLGIGIVRSFNSFRPDAFKDFSFGNREIDTLLIDGRLSGIGLDNGWGYRAVFGGRYKEKYSLEMGLQTTWSDFVFRIEHPDENLPGIAVFRASKLSTVWITIGYIISL
ncbi:MAG: hypothetical protein JSV44_09290 [Candidatus Zixiibacteriota bacterium]|nr:MAG: hypothetical protein JSV44_09290 [candidate division Zixibacteria bacterium]